MGWNKRELTCSAPNQCWGSSRYWFQMEKESNVSPHIINSSGAPKIHCGKGRNPLWWNINMLLIHGTTGGLFGLTWIVRSSELVHFNRNFGNFNYNYSNNEFSHFTFHSNTYDFLRGCVNWLFSQLFGLFQKFKSLFMLWDNNWSFFFLTNLLPFLNKRISKGPKSLVSNTFFRYFFNPSTYLFMWCNWHIQRML